MKKLTLLLAIAVIASTSYGQKTNFSGTWKLNEAKSELFQQFSIAPSQLIIKHARKSIEIERQGEMQGQEYTTNDVFTLDGKECENQGFGDLPKKSTVEWDKKSGMMAITSKIELDDGSDVEIIEKLTMKEGDLVVDLEASSPMGEMYEIQVFDKE